MKTQYNLRAWHKIEADISREINSLTFDIRSNGSSVKVPRYSQDVQTAFDCAMIEKEAQIEKLFKLSQIRKDIRDTIQEKNIGEINAAISNKKNLEQNLIVINNILNEAEVCPEDVQKYFELKLEDSQNQSSGYRSTTAKDILIPSLSSEMITQYKNKRSAMKRQIRSIEDQLLVLNTKDEVSILSSEDLAFLESHDIV